MAEIEQMAEAPVAAPGVRTSPAVAWLAGWGAALRRGLARLWRISALRTALGMWGATRALYILLTWFGVLFSPVNSNQASGHPSLTQHAFLYHWWIWDSGWYIIVAQGGYQRPSEAAYFPLYPALIHLFTGLFPTLDPLVIALCISNIGALLTFIAVALLANFDAGEPAAARYALRALAAYPFALYLFAAYSEGVFLACAAWALLAARRGWWWLAILAGVLAGLARPFGLALVLPLLWEFGRQHGWWEHLRQLWAHRRAMRDWLATIDIPDGWWRTALTGTLVTYAVPIGTGLYALYCWHIFGDPLVFIHANDHGSAGILAGIALALRQIRAAAPWSYPLARMLVDALPLAALGALTLATVRRIPFAYTLMMLGVCAICLGTPYVNAIFPDVYVSAGRYVLAALPMFLIVGQWTRKWGWLETLLINGGWAIQAIFLVFLFNGGWLV
jgi:hypothetical protein